MLNIVKDTEGCYKWRINLDGIGANLLNIVDFPSLSSTFEKPTLFLGGSKSEHIT